jgi:hypothetical protein
MEKEFTLIPYVKVEGQWTASYSFIHGLWCKMVRDGTVHRVFYGGSVKNVGEFVDWLKLPSNHVLLALDKDASTPLGFCWLNGVEDRRGWFGFCLFSETWGKDAIKLLEAMRDYWMGMKDENGQYVFHILLGVTPVTNRLALMAMKSIGAKRGTPIPDLSTNATTGRRVAGVISYYMRGYDG